jgi:4-amino-4-deoxy-L-arabinose transferase-like glycosyltransferase
VENISHSGPRWLPSPARFAKYDRCALLFLVCTSLLRLTQLTRFELAPDEAYYWDWSRQLSWGYYDQGPMIGYVIRLTTLLFGTNTFGVRVGVWAASLGTLVCCWLLARRIFSPLAALYTVVLLGVTPLVAVGSLIATYDPILVFFWALALVFLERALFACDEAPPRRAWLWTGIATGLGFLSKHTMLLILPCTLLFLAASPMHRKWLRRPEPYAGFALTLLLYGGVFWWNAHHHWWTFGHLLFLAHKSTNSPFSRLGEFVGSQALLLGPGLFIAVVGAGYRVFNTLKGEGEREKRRREEEKKRSKEKDSAFSLPPSAIPNAPLLFLFCMGYPIFAFFCLMAIRAKVQANWAPCAWITPTILWAGWMAGKEEEKKRRREEERKRGLLLSLVVVPSALLTLLLISPGLRQAVLVRLKPSEDVTTQMVGWNSLATHVQAIRTDMERGGRKVFIAGNGYQYCALMAFYLPDHPLTYDMYLHYRLTMYAAHVERLQLHLGEDAIFINDGRADDADLHAVFERVEWEEPPFLIWRRPLNAEPVRIIHIARCYGYRRYTGLDWAVGG